MKSYSNCSNAGEINIDLLYLFCSKLCLTTINDHISNLKDYGDFAEENKQYDSVIVNMMTLSLMMLQVGVSLKKTHLIFSSSWPYWDTSHQ